MKPRQIFLIYFVLLYLLIITLDVSAAECGATPTNGCTISQSTTFNPGTYNLPGGIVIIRSNLVLDCNNAVLDGGTTTSSGITIMQTATKNLVIKNCNVTNYENAIKTVSNLTGSSILNSNFIQNRRE